MLPLALVLSLLIGVSLGLLGGGGSILTTPILIYALGVEPKEAIATSLLVVAITSVAGAIQHFRQGNVELKIGLIFGAAVPYWTELLGAVLVIAAIAATAIGSLRGRGRAGGIAPAALDSPGSTRSGRPS